MNLLLITKDEKKHYVLIKDFNAFMYNQSKHKERKHFSMYCLQCFSSERILASHVNNCLTINGAQAINMPKQGENILKFNNFHKQLPVNFVIYADFEAIMKKVQGCIQSEEIKKDKDRRSYTEVYQTHEDCGYGYKVQSVSWILAEFYFNRGLQRLYTGTCIILQKTINGFICLLIVFLKSKTYQLILKDLIKLNRNLR